MCCRGNRSHPWRRFADTPLRRESVPGPESPRGTGVVDCGDHTTLGPGASPLTGTPLTTWTIGLISPAGPWLRYPSATARPSPPRGRTSARRWRRRSGVCRGWGAAGQPGGSSRRLCARDATVGVFRHRLASGSPQDPKRRALAAGPVEGVDLRPRCLQLWQPGGALGLMDENLNCGGLPRKPRGLEVTVVHELPALSLEGGDIHAGGRIGLVRAALSWLPGRGCKADDTPSQPAARELMRSSRTRCSIEMHRVNWQWGNVVASNR